MQSFERIKNLQKTLRDRQLDALLVTSPANIFYLTGINNFDAEKGFLLAVTKTKWRVISSLFYQNRIDGAVPAANIKYIGRGESMSAYAAKETGGAKNIGFERDDITFARYEIFKKAFRGMKLVATSGIIEQFRKTKDRDELSLVKKAAAITDRTFAEIVKLAKPGVSELYLKRKTLEIMQDLGAQGCSFDPIIAAGKSGADPHYEGSNRRIRAGEMIVIDIGARYKNYDADMTRMVFMGKATEKYKKLYQAVLETQEKSLNDCVLGADTKTVYENSVANLRKNDLDQYYTHGLGHGVGIDIHEAPSLSVGGNDTFQNGMVFTVEPGIYIPGWGGIRIEDLCVMKNNKLEILSKTPKTLIEIK